MADAQTLREIAERVQKNVEELVRDMSRRAADDAKTTTDYAISYAHLAKAAVLWSCANAIMDANPDTLAASQEQRRG